jgi:predicted PurR-regulated permease PerM
MANAAQERVVSFRPRTVLVVLGILLATLALLSLVYLAWHIITWILIAVFLALALDPAVEFFARRGLRRGYATGIVFILAIGLIAGLGFLLVPPLVDQVRSFVDYVPKVIDDVTAGRGPFGFLQTEYHIVDRVREAIDKQGASGGGSGPAGSCRNARPVAGRRGA